MFDISIREDQLTDICKTRIEQFRRAAELENQIPHVSWRHRIATTLIAWARKLEPESKPSRTLTV
jgi:hypothetical protein